MKISQARHDGRTGRLVHAARWLSGIAALAVLCFSMTAERAGAGDKPPFPARSGVTVADAAARSWASDATLVYLENDEDVDGAGYSERWGYLYYSPALETARVFSVRDGKVLVAENLEMLFDAPPLASQWIDSGQAVAVAEQMAGQSYRQLHQGKLSTMLLMRGAFYSGDANQTTWTLIYTSPHAPSLFVVVDAADGSVRRTWRG